jgi:hypothetical protein
MKLQIVALFPLVTGLAFAVGNPTLDFAKPSIELPQLSLSRVAEALLTPFDLVAKKPDSSAPVIIQIMDERNGVWVPQQNLDPRIAVSSDVICDPKIIIQVPSARLAK